MALRWEDINLAENVIRVRRSWDPQAGEIAPKSRSGVRRVPVASALRKHLVTHQIASGRREGNVFGRSSLTPFCPSTLAGRAHRAWRNAKLDPIGLHEARHTFASLMIAAGVNAKVLSTYMGHASITITLDRYGHLMPGNEEYAAALLDGYLTSTAARAESSLLGDYRQKTSAESAELD